MRPKPSFNTYEIGPSSFARRVRGLIGYGLFFALIVAAFVYLFVLLTLSWRIAIGSVTLLVGYMAATAWWVERHAASGRDDAMR